MKIVFMGTPDFALPALQKLTEQHEVICIYTQPARPRGRGYELTPSPVAQFGESKGIPVRTPTSLKSLEEQEAFKSLNADVAVVAAYGLLLPKAILDAFPLGCVNIHGSLLPRWRGAAPIQRAVQAGDKETGVTIMQMDIGMDTGDILLQKSIEIANLSSKELFPLIAQLGANALLEYLENPNSFSPTKQDDSLATHAPKINKSESELDFSLPAEVLERQIRAFSSWFIYKGTRIKVLKAQVLEDKVESNLAGHFIGNADLACQDGVVLRMLELQREGKSSLPAKEFLRGFTFD